MNMADLPAKPNPTHSELAGPYWDGVAAGHLLLQTCTSCGTVRHYPRLLCARCYAEGVEWKSASGRGRIHSWTVAHHAFHPAFVGDLPYTLVTVDLEEGPRALGRWQGGTPMIGQPVLGKFVAREAGHDLVFAPVE